MGQIKPVKKGQVQSKPGQKTQTQKPSKPTVKK